MSPAFVDTDVLIRLLAGDDPRKQAAAAHLFEQVEAGTLTISAPDTVIADAVFVLHSPHLYALPRAEVARLLTALVRLAGFTIHNRRVVLRALALFGERPIDFGDAMLVASMERDGTEELYSYDRDFDTLPGIQRVEP